MDKEVGDSNIYMGEAQIYDWQKTDYDMTQKAMEFDHIQRAFFMGNISDRELMEVTTQPFWESMKLQKQRLDRYEIKMDYNLPENNRTNAILSQIAARQMQRPSFLDMSTCGYALSREEGQFCVGTSEVNVKSNKIFYRHGKKIYTNKDHEKRITSLLQATGNADKAMCPNCGHEGTIASFIDGCDYCNAKFSVNDFQPKVSGFSIDENPVKKTNVTFGKVLAGLGIASAILLFIALVSLGIMLASTVMNTGLKETTNSILLYIVATTLLPIMRATIFISFFIFIMLWIYLNMKQKNLVINAETVKTMLPDFSVGDFQQHLEYLLKNIHYADQVSKISSFAYCDLTKQVSEYQDVVDCCMTRLEFMDIGEYATYYQISAQVSMKISRFDGKKIRNDREKINLVITGDRSMINRKMMAIREYKCPDCGASVSLLNGGTCRYCGTKLDYAKYGWMINSYATQKDTINRYQRIKLGLVSIYLVIFIISSFLFIHKATKEVTSETGDYTIQEAISMANEFYDDFVLPDDICEVEQISVDEGYVNRRYEYSCENGAKEASIYAQYLRDHEGYENIGNGEFLMRKKITMANTKLYHSVSVTYTDTTVTVYEEIEDMEE